MAFNFGRNKKKADEDLELEEDIDEEEVRAGPLAPRDADDDDNDEVYEAVEDEGSSGNGKTIAIAAVLFLVAIGGAWAKGYVNIPFLPTRGGTVNVAAASKPSDEAQLKNLGGQGKKSAKPIGSVEPKSSEGTLIDTAGLVSPANTPVDSGVKTKGAPAESTKAKGGAPALIILPEASAAGITSSNANSSNSSNSGTGGAITNSKSGPKGLIKEASPPVSGVVGTEGVKVSQKEILKQRLDSIELVKKAKKQARADSIKFAKEYADARKVAIMDSIKNEKAEKAAAKERAKAEALMNRAQGTLAEAPESGLNSSGSALNSNSASNRSTEESSGVAAPVKPKVNTAKYAYDDPRAPWNKSKAKKAGVKEVGTKSKGSNALPYDDPNAPWNK